MSQWTTLDKETVSIADGVLTRATKDKVQHIRLDTITQTEVRNGSRLDGLGCMLSVALIVPVFWVLVPFILLVMVFRKPQSYVYISAPDNNAILLVDKVQAQEIMAALNPPAPPTLNPITPA